MTIMVVYHVMTGLFAAIMIRNFVKTKDIQKAILYLVVLMPFLLRVFHLK